MAPLPPSLPPIRIFALPLLRLPLQQGGKLIPTASSPSQPLIYWHISQHYPPKASTSTSGSETVQVKETSPSDDVNLLQPSTWPPAAKVPGVLIDKASAIWLSWGQKPSALRREILAAKASGGGFASKSAAGEAATEKTALVKPVQAVGTAELSTREQWSVRIQGWKFRVWTTGESLMDRIGFEEWGLKTVNPLVSTPAKEGETDVVVPREKIPLYIPPTSSFTLDPTIPPPTLLTNHITSRLPHHRTYMIRSLLLVPLLAPIGLLPVVPNLPAFYVIWRAWSHWKAGKGGAWVLDQMKADGEPVGGSGMVEVVQSEELRKVLEGSKERAVKSVGADQDAEDALVGHTTPETAPDTTATPSSLTVNPSPSAPTPTLDPILEDSDLLLRESDIPLLAEQFHFSPAEVVDIHRAVVQARQRLESWKKAEAGEAGKREA